MRQNFSGTEEELVEAILNSSEKSVVNTILATDERVIARVTDGIYRQPGSALRELISNAYDADATEVFVKTDAPRFQRITVEDNGRGMSPEAVAHVIRHIGGSAKRTTDGNTLGVTSNRDSTLSPGGRKLIGKIGIGLFSVSQLTHEFQIISKVKGDSFRTVASITLRQYSDLPTKQSTTQSRPEYESAKVSIWREKAFDKQSQGTSIILSKIRREALDTLRSRNLWDAFDQVDQEEGDEYHVVELPKYNIGRVDASGKYLLKTQTGFDSLPWTVKDSPQLAFSKMVNCVWDELNFATNPQLSDFFDNYLQMIWQLSLAIPLPYVQGHLFDEPSKGWMKLYKVSNKQKGSAELISGTKGKSIRDELGMSSRTVSSEDFKVRFDNLELCHPLKYRDLPKVNHSFTQPMVFIGKCDEVFKTLPSELSGGKLSFEAYLFWNPKIAPKEHQGSLIRIFGASGTLFDSKFMNYQVSELTRLKQITCEIFVNEGLESSLNIDRESFNAAHPHAVFISKWLHSALRQLATAQKREANKLRDQKKAQAQEASVSAIKNIVSNIWLQETYGNGSEPPLVDFDEETEGRAVRGAIRISRSSVSRGGARFKFSSVTEEKLKGIIQVLASFGLLEGLSKKRRDSLARAISEILGASD